MERLDRMHNHISERTKDRAYGGLFALLVLALGVLTAVSLNQSLQSDEIYSMDLIGHSWLEMLTLAAADVHPPLYYVIIKLFADVLGGVELSRRILITQAVSILPLWMLFLLSATVIRRHYGRRVSILFAGFLIGLPSLIHINAEIRMYGWGMLFVTIAALMAALVMQREDTRVTWGFLLVSSIAACYTHYFCDVAIFYVYVLLLVWAICNCREHVRTVLIQAAVVVIAFLPWMFGALIHQVSGVAESYWIEEIGFADVLDYLKFFLAPYTNASIIRIPLEILMAAILLYVLIRSTRNRQWDVLYLMAIVLCVVGTGIGISVIFRPVYASRYAVPACGASCLGLAISIARLLPAQLSLQDSVCRRSGSTIAACGMLLVIVAVSAIDMLSFAKNQWSYGRDYDRLEATLIEPAREAADQGETVSIITDSAYFHSALAYYLPAATVYRPGYTTAEYEQRQAILDNLATYTEEMPIPEGEIWVVHSTLEDDALLQMIDVSGVEPVHAGLDQTKVLIYHLEN